MAGKKKPGIPVKSINIKLRMINDLIDVTGSAKDSWNPAEISDDMKAIAYIHDLADTWNPAQLNEALKYLGFATIDSWNPAIIEETKNKLVKYFLPTNASGNPIELDFKGTLPYEVTSLTIDLLPIQDLSHGEPSPTNICPISGRTELNLTRTGANVWDEVWEQGGINVNNGNNQTADNRIRSKNYIPVKEGEKYYTTQELGIFTYNANKVFIEYLTGSAITGEFTIPSGVSYIRFRSTSAYGGTYHNNIAINYPSTVTTYSAYNSETVTVQFGQTVYGGTLDVTNGKLTIDKEYRLLNGLENWTVISSGTESYFYSLQLPSTTYAVDSSIISNMFPQGNISSSTTTVGIVHCTSGYIRFRPFDTELSVADWKTWLQSNNVQITFGIQTPIEITLTAEQISLLNGINVLSTDGDNINITYKAILNS